MSEPGATAPASNPAAEADDWDQHWSRYASAAALNPAQAFRRRLVIDALAISRPRAHVLDVGSGTGDLASELVRDLPEPEIVGVELSAIGVEIAARKVPEAEFVECDLLAGPPPLERHVGWADYAVCSEVLEHVDDPALLIGNARALMAPGCRLVVTVPGGPMSAFDRSIGHRRHFSADDLRAVLASAGFERIDARAVGFPIFNLYRLAVIAAGERLVAAEASASGAMPPSRAVRWGGKVFEPLLRVNRGGRRLGFQIVAVARNPGPRD